MNTPKPATDFIIQYAGTPKTYFKQLTRIGPRFGASILDTPKYKTEEEARAVVRTFPTVAQVMCDVVPRRKP